MSVLAHAVPIQAGNQSKRANRVVGLSEERDTMHNTGFLDFFTSAKRLIQD